MDEGKSRTLKLNRSTIGRTRVLMIVCGIVAFIVLLAQLYKVMIIDHDRYQSEAVEQQVRETTITAARGTIFDTNMKMLAVSASVDTVYISPVEMRSYNEDPEFIALNLSNILGVDYNKIMSKWENTNSWYEVVARKIDRDLSEKVLEFKNTYNLASLHIIEDTKRYYPYSTLAAHTLGFVGAENTGLEGIETYYDKYLSGVNGRIVRATTSEGLDLLYSGYENYYDAKDGHSIVLTIDTTAQFYLEKYLEQAIEDYDVKNGAMGIIMDVNTGAVIGMSTMPDYDLNDYLNLSDKTKAELDALNLSQEEYNKAYANALEASWRNRVISDTYEPGSTFKIITLASAMEEGVARENDIINCGGNIMVKGRGADDPVNCWKREGHGPQTLVEAAQHSCNVAFVSIALKLGADKFYDYIQSFGLMDKTGIDLYGESSSIWWAKSDYTDPYDYSSLAASAFGQTFNITPLQLITAVSAVANGGRLMQPYIVSKILNEDGSVAQTREPTLIRQVISEETSARVNAILETVVSAKGGTGKNAYVAGYRIAGKTGTSEKIGQVSDDYVVSFIGYAPADDPKIAVIVLLDSPSPDSGFAVSGGAMAAPVVANIMSDVLPHLGVEPIYSDDDANTINIKLPNLSGYTRDDAVDTLRALGFDVTVIGNGDIITDQVPGANVQIASGQKLTVYAGESKTETTTQMPNVFGMSYAQAKATLNAAGLYVRVAGATLRNNAPTIAVSRQSVAAGASVLVGMVVEITLVDNDSSVLEGALD